MGSIRVSGDNVFNLCRRADDINEGGVGDDKLVVLRYALLVSLTGFLTSDFGRRTQLQVPYRQPWQPMAHQRLLRVSYSLIGGSYRRLLGKTNLTD